ncbi:MAG: 2-C-methyl-D-erythritol 4-phosphate cytidylyltransferase [Bacteroidetes bacterium]|jgi:2-C-methyl-D-erythritol 4-phosphate cytidylyltransferase|nr:2-C-methyl-D-erythritol 4-phosphate cytidylyltransferase [Bacteroidota bacterium]
MKKYAVIVAGGSGVRMGATTPKQFLLLNNKPILWHTINAFLNSYNDIEIIVVLPKEHLQIGEDIKNIFINNIAQITLTTGGKTRFDSVKNGLQHIKEDSVVFVHDAVRCLLDRDLIERCYNQAVEKGSAIPVVAATDSIRIDDNGKHHIVNRNHIKIVQTPQTFLSKIILPAFEQNYNETFTDEATVVEAFGTNVFLCHGNYNNIKITRPVDLIIAEKLIGNF